MDDEYILAWVMSKLLNSQTPKLLKNKKINHQKNNTKMKTTIQELEDKYLVTLEGELDTAAAVEVEKTLQPLYTSNGRDIVIDCTNLEYIASSGLRILISILKGAKAGGSKVIMRNMNDDIKTVFKLTGFINLFEFEEV